MQLRILLKKDLSALFKQRSVIFALLFPSIIIMFIGITPLFIQSTDPFQLGYFIEDEGIMIDSNELNLGSLVLNDFLTAFDADSSIELVKLDNSTSFYNFENAVWIPKNFTELANNTRIATYFTIISDTDLRANSIMSGNVAQIIESIVTFELLPVIAPTINATQVYAADGLLDSGEAKNRGDVARVIAYIVFLILIMGSSSMRLTGFSAEREADMMEVLLSTVIDRKEMILSKLITGVLFGIASLMSYLLGFSVVILVARSNPASSGQNIIDIPSGLINVTNILIITFLFIMLSFLSMEILLAAQLVLGREGGDRLGSTGLMILTFMFYAISIADPLSETPLQIINPFFWVYKISINIIFREEYFKTAIYLILTFIVSSALLIVQTKAIERERVLFE